VTDLETLHPLRPFLKNWLWEHGHIGTRYLDCSNGDLKFDEGKKARFAAEQPLYVPLTKDDTTASRTSPNLHEAGLAKFLRAAQLSKPEEAGAPAEMQRAVQDCVEIALLCAYQALALRAQAHYAQEAMFDDEIRAAVCADIRKLYVPIREQLALYDFVVFYGLPSALLISESPFVDWRMRAKPPKPFVSMPLGPYALLVGAPSAKTSRVGPVVWTKAVAMGPFKDHNQHVVDHAKHWIVATTDEQLVALQPKFAPPQPAAPQVATPEIPAPSASS
jgi:hypothetical protein